MKAKTVVAAIWIFGVIGLIVGGLAWWKYRSIREAMSQPQFEPSETVRTAAVRQFPFQRTASAVGTVSAIRHGTVAVEVAGKVSSVGFTSGETVEQGRVLVTLDASTEEADLRAAEANAALARVSLARLEQAMSGNAVSKQEIDRARAERDAAEARVEQIRAMIRKKTVRAAYPGRLGLRNIHPGQYVAEGTAITTLQGLDEQVYVDFSVPQVQAGLVPVGSTVEVLVMGRALPARVTAVDAQIEVNTRNARIRAELPATFDAGPMGSQSLKPGMFVDVRFALGEPVSVLVVPATAIRRAPFGDHVFVVEPDPKDSSRLLARQRFVRVTGSAPGGAIVSEGLEPGLMVATDGSFKLRDGMLVIPSSQAPAGDGPGPDPTKPGKGGEGEKVGGASASTKGG